VKANTFEEHAVWRNPPDYTGPALEHQIFHVSQAQRTRTYIINTSWITSGNELK
jgi:hypothetical protein